jgi:hypothetical protein
MIFPSLFAIIVGLVMIGWWITLYRSGQIPELETEPIAIRFHLAGEFSTAVALIISGIGLLVGQSWSVWLYLVATGMLLYTVIVSPRYALQQGQWPTAGLLGVLLPLSILCIFLVI